MKGNILIYLHHDRETSTLLIKDSSIIHLSKICDSGKVQKEMKYPNIYTYIYIYIYIYILHHIYRQTDR